MEKKTESAAEIQANSLKHIRWLRRAQKARKDLTEEKREEILKALDKLESYLK